MKFSIGEGSFKIDDKKVFLNAGEIHYFRIKKDLWDKHLSAASDAGLTAISTYVPWAWHEPEEGIFDFDGTTLPERDLNGWIKKCSEHNLMCILKPGPFILAEFRGAGLPFWFLEKYGNEAKMRTRSGEKVLSDGISFFNKNYLEKAALWYDRIMPVIRDAEVAAGGPVIMMQLCNEIGVYTWLAKQADYGNSVRERFLNYLSEKFTDIGELNQLWNTDYNGFPDVEMPPDGILPYSSPADRGRDYEWHCFWRKYYGDYLRLVCKMARDRGVTVPFYHNLPGWIYGNGYEFPVNITMYDDLFAEKSGILFGVDHIPEFVSYRNLHDDRIINDITLSKQPGFPLFAAELQCGSREYHVVTNPREMELFYKACIANGIKGWNFYMFSQGKNPRHLGHSGDTFYWFTPLTSEGDRTSSFPLVKKMSRIVGRCENIIANADRRAEICVLFYSPYYATELERPSSGNEFSFDKSSIRRPAYFDGLLKALLVLNIDYDMADLETVSPDQLGKYKQVWAFCTDEMNRSDQQKLVDYIFNGGNLVIFPALPDREMSQKPCSLIRDALDVHPVGKEIIESPLIDVFDLKDIKCGNPQIIFPEQINEGEIISRTIRGKPCGFIKKAGKGSVIHLGTWIGFDTEGQKPVYEKILQQSGAVIRKACTGSDYLIIRERFTDNGQGILFIGNYYNEEHSGSVKYTHPVTGESVNLPYSVDSMSWPPLYGVLTPLCQQVVDGLLILHCTSDILGVNHNDHTVEIKVSGDRDLRGEIVFEGVLAHSIRSAKVWENELAQNSDNNRVWFNYEHMQRGGEMILRFEII